MKMGEKSKLSENGREENRCRQQQKSTIAAIDISVVRRMVVWAIEESERQLENLRNTLEVIDGLALKDDTAATPGQN